MRYFFLTCIMLLGLSHANSQNEDFAIDSLEKAVSAQEGEMKVKTMLALSGKLKSISLDKCILKAEQAEIEAQKTGNSKLVALANLELSKVYIDCYDFDLAESCLRKALANMEDCSDAEKCSVYVNLANIILKTGDSDSAAFYYVKLRDLAQATNDLNQYANAINKLAIISRNKGNQEEAMKGFKEAVGVYIQTGDSLSAARSLSNIAMLHSANHQYEEALSILNELALLFEKKGDYSDLSMTYSNIGMIKSRYADNIDTAIVIMEKARHFADLVGDSLMMVDILLNEGDMYLMCNNTDRAFVNFEEARQLASRLSFEEGLTATYVRFAEANYLVGEYDKSKEYIMACMEIEAKNGTYLYTPLLKPYLIMDYAHLGEYDSLESELARREADNNKLRAEKLQFEQKAIDVLAIREAKEMSDAKVTKLQYVVAGLATLLIVLVLYTLFLGRPKKEK